MSANEIAEITQSAERVRKSKYAQVAILLVQYVQFYCSGKAETDIPDAIYDFVEYGKSSEDPLVETLLNSDISDDVRFLAQIVMEYENALAYGELTDEIEEMNEQVFDHLYAGE